MAIDVDHFDLSNGRAAVLGAETPAGGAVARAYAEAGADVMICVPEEDESSRILCKDIETLGARCELFEVGMSGPESAGDAVRHAASVLGGLDILASCPDLFHAKPITETSDAELARVMATNFGVQFAAVRAAACEMRTSGGGKIVLLGHVLGERGLPNTSAYGAAHAATQSLVRSLARELGPDAITINGIALGWMDWMSDRIDPEDEEATRAVRFAILKRAGRADEVGPLAVWLSASGAGYVTGQIFHIDGGLTQHM